MPPPPPQQLLRSALPQGTAAQLPARAPVPGGYASAEPRPDHPGSQRLPTACPHGDLPVCSPTAPGMRPADPQVEAGVGRVLGTQPVNPGGGGFLGASPEP